MGLWIKKGWAGSLWFLQLKTLEGWEGNINNGGYNKHINWHVGVRIGQIMGIGDGWDCIATGTMATKTRRADCIPPRGRQQSTWWRQGCILPTSCMHRRPPCPMWTPGTDDDNDADTHWTTWHWWKGGKQRCLQGLCCHFLAIKPKALIVMSVWCLYAFISAVMAVLSLFWHHHGQYALRTTDFELITN